MVRVLELCLAAMCNFFMLGSTLVRWDLTALGEGGTGPYRLVIHHEGGVIAEYFDDVTSALLWQGDLEDLLVAAPATPVWNTWGHELRAPMSPGRD